MLNCFEGFSNFKRNVSDVYNVNGFHFYLLMARLLFNFGITIFAIVEISKDFNIFLYCGPHYTFRFDNVHDNSTTSTCMSTNSNQCQTLNITAGPAVCSECPNAQFCGYSSPPYVGVDFVATYPYYHCEHPLCMYGFYGVIFLIVRIILSFLSGNLTLVNSYLSKTFRPWYDIHYLLNRLTNLFGFLAGYFLLVGVDKNQSDLTNETVLPALLTLAVSLLVETFIDLIHDIIFIEKRWIASAEYLGLHWRDISTKVPKNMKLSSAEE